ncbi:mCG52314 [Mus musculus]|nr:mCG52314 [Mus musculus]
MDGRKNGGSLSSSLLSLAAFERRSTSSNLMPKANAPILAYASVSNAVEITR